jgi:GH18 family chitinase
MKSTIGDKSLSIALPASYWYLKTFPIAKMSDYVSYFIYMTYDLHGQWGEFINIIPGSLSMKLTNEMNLNRL